MVHHRSFSKSSNDQKVDVGPDGHVAEEEAQKKKCRRRHLRPKKKCRRRTHIHAWPATIWRTPGDE